MNSVSASSKFIVLCILLQILVIKFGTHSDLQFRTSNMAHGLEFVSTVYFTVGRSSSQYSGTDIGKK